MIRTFFLPIIFLLPAFALLANSISFLFTQYATRAFKSHAILNHSRKLLNSWFSTNHILIIQKLGISYQKNLNVKLALALVVLVFFAQGCSSPALQKQVNDQDISLQIMNLDSGSNTSDVITYKARIVPAKRLLDEKSQADKNALVYQMDSCFYLQSGIKKIYASLVQPIANGVSGSFEYLLEFEKSDRSDPGEFIYQDKYLNRKKYSIKLNSDNL